jgi:hypothetical protein
MTIVPGPQPGHPPRDLAVRLFRVLHTEFELRTIDGTHVAVPRGTPWYSGRSLTDLARQISSTPPADRLLITAISTRTRAGREHMISLPAPQDAARLTRFLGEHPRWSVFWDKAYGVWRAAEDDPDSALYAESCDVDTVTGYIAAHA